MPRQKNILITGSTGMLGVKLIQQFGNNPKFRVYGLSRTKSNLIPMSQQIIVDLSSPDCAKKIPQFLPDIIIHTAAITDLALCESDPQLAKRVNVDGAKAIAKMTGKRTGFFYISTDSIFDGEKGNYKEADQPFPVNAYAKSKLEGEFAVLENAEGQVSIIRTNIYGYHVPMRNSLAEWAYNQWTELKPIKGFTDTIFNAVSISQLGSTLDIMIEMEVFFPILNIGSKEVLSKYEFLNQFRKVLGVSSQLLTPALSSEFQSKILRPKNTSLNTELLSTFCQVPSVDSGLHGWQQEVQSIFITKSKFVS